MTTFTPGPWTVDYVCDAIRQYPYVRSPAGQICGKVDSPDDYGMEAAEANAQLIAAAPELYAALNAVLTGFETGEFKRTRPRQSDTDPYHPALVAARAALAKVESPN
jgi:hypothetical protein